MRRLGPLVAVAFLVAVPVPVAAQPHPGILDITEILQLVPDGERIVSGPSAGLWPVGDDLIGLSVTGEGTAAVCHLIRIAGGREAAVHVGSDMPCPKGGRMVGYDADADLALLCIDGQISDALLFARDLGGNERWKVGVTLAEPADGAPVQVPPQVGGPLGTVLGGAGQIADDVGPPLGPLVPDPKWQCASAVVANGSIFVVFGDLYGRHRIESLSMDGTSVWSTSVPADRLLPGADQIPSDVANGTQNLGAVVPVFTPYDIVATESGLIVPGAIGGTIIPGTAIGNAGLGAVVWLDFDGKIMGTAAGMATIPQGTILPRSRSFDVEGRLGGGMLDGRLFVVDPANTQGTFTTLSDVASSETLLASPRWVGDVLALPGQSSVFLRQPQDPSHALSKELARQYWAGFEGGRIHDLVLGPTGQAQAVIASRQGSVNVADLVTFSLDFGESLLRLPLNITVSPGTGFSLHLTPLPGGELLAWDESGAAAIASEASHIPGPRISVDTDYPPVNGALKVEVSHGDANPDVELFLAWGEGRLEKVHDGARVESTYDRLGKATIRLTALYPSGTTSTATYVVDVGGKPDEPNNLFDYLFAAERQNYTFFGLGLLLSLIGVLLGLLARYKGRNRMEKEFGLLDKVREEGRPDAFAAIRHLHDYRLHLRDFLSRGKLEEPQYTVLVAAANGVLELLRQRILGAFLGRVSAHFSHTLDLALQDGTIDEGEARNLLGQAHKEAKLTSDERKRLELMVRSWQKSIGKPV